MNCRGARRTVLCKKDVYEIRGIQVLMEEDEKYYSVALNQLTALKMELDPSSKLVFV